MFKSKTLIIISDFTPVCPKKSIFLHPCMKTTLKLTNYALDKKLQNFKAVKGFSVVIAHKRIVRTPTYL